MNIIRGLWVLKNVLPADAMADFYLLEAEMLEYLHRLRLDNPKNRPTVVERDRILRELDRLARTHSGRDFHALCEEPVAAWSFSAASLSSARHSEQITAQVPPSHAPNVSVQQVRSSIQLISQKSIPTASCYFQSATPFPPPATIIVNNTDAASEPFSLRTVASIENYSDFAIKDTDIPRGKNERIELVPLFKPTALATLNETRSATLHVAIKYTSASQRWDYETTEPVQLYARNTAILAVQRPDGSDARDLTDSLAAWVTPHRPEIEQLLNLAAQEYHPRHTFTGYQDDDEASTHEQARALFDVLQYETRLVYISSPLSLGGQPGQIAQRIRLPTEVLRSGGSANCLDGAVLFASLLELATLQPVLVLIRQHALVGWRVAPETEEYEFLDTTCIGEEDFTTAQRIAHEQYQEARARGDFEKPVSEAPNFARLIDVLACHQGGIDPLE